MLHTLVDEWTTYYVETMAYDKNNPSTPEAFIEVEYARFRNDYKSSKFKQYTRNLIDYNIMLITVS